MYFFHPQWQRSRALLGLAFLGLGLTPASAKTRQECNAEYVANKASIEGVQKRSAFMAACRANSGVLPPTAPSPTAAAPSGTGASSRGAAASPSGTPGSPPGAANALPGAKLPAQIGPAQVRKPSAKDLAEERKLKRDMNICIGC